MKWRRLDLSPLLNTRHLRFQVAFSLPPGIRHLPAYLSRDEQLELVEHIREICVAAPLYTPHMPRSGQPMSVRMTNCGFLGWYTDKANGYRYIAEHPETGKPWPAIPERLLEIWSEFSGCDKKPEACLINFYSTEAKMGLHADIDEQAFDCPVISISLGDDCLFRVGGLSRKDKTRSFRLCSGDLVIIGGENRKAFHGVDRIYAGTSDLLKNGGRINITMRRVNP